MAIWPNTVFDATPTSCNRAPAAVITAPKLDMAGTNPVANAPAMPVRSAIKPAANPAKTGRDVFSAETMPTIPLVIWPTASPAPVKSRRLSASNGSASMVSPRNPPKNCWSFWEAPVMASEIKSNCWALAFIVSANPPTAVRAEEMLPSKSAKKVFSRPPARPKMSMESAVLWASLPIRAMAWPMVRICCSGDISERRPTESPSCSNAATWVALP